MQGPMPIFPLVVLAFVVLCIVGWVVATVYTYVGHAAG